MGHSIRGTPCIFASHFGKSYSLALSFAAGFIVFTSHLQSQFQQQLLHGFQDDSCNSIGLGREIRQVYEAWNRQLCAPASDRSDQFLGLGQLVSKAFETQRRLAPIGRVCLEAGRIGGNHRTNLFTSVSVVTIGICGVRPQLVKIGGRKINSQLDVVLPGRVGNFPDQITPSLPATDWRQPNGLSSGWATS